MLGRLFRGLNRMADAAEATADTLTEVNVKLRRRFGLDEADDAINGGAVRELPAQPEPTGEGEPTPARKRQRA